MCSRGSFDNRRNLRDRLFLPCRLQQRGSIIIKPVFPRRFLCLGRQRRDLDGAVDLLGEDLHPSDDIQASAAVKLHLAGVLLRRVAKQLTTPQTLERRA